MRTFRDKNGAVTSGSNKNTGYKLSDPENTGENVTESPIHRNFTVRKVTHPVTAKKQPDNYIKEVK